MAAPPRHHHHHHHHALDDDGGGIRIRGWRVRATRAPIVGDAAMEAAARDLGAVLTVPEILFGNSGLTLTHEASGVTLSFGALDALRAWRQEDLPPLKVTAAAAWQESRREEIQRQGAVVLEYDWTYTTPYQGTLKAGGAAGAAAAAGEAAGEVAAAADANGAAGAGSSSNGSSSNGSSSNGGGCGGGGGEGSGSGGGGRLKEICTSLRTPAQTPAAAAQAMARATAEADAAPFPPPAASASSSGGPAPGPLLPLAPGGGLPQWRPTRLQADRALLLSRAEPILFFGEVPLYESELDDNGSSQLVAKVRVMPRCWLVLLRFWLRVDGALVRLRETRLFCRFDKPETAGLVLRETKHFEGTVAQLRAAGAPVSATAYPDSDATAALFSAIAPSCLTRFELHELRLA